MIVPERTKRPQTNNPHISLIKFSKNVLNKNIFYTLLLILTGSSNATAQNGFGPATVIALQKKLDSCVTHFKVPGISAALIMSGDRMWSGASGLSDIQTNEPLDTSMVFQQASICKMFAATLVFQLIEENKLSLDDTIGKYLPPLKNVPPGTKIRYLLNHRSGIADVLEHPDAADTWFSAPDSIWKPEKVIEAYCGTPKFRQNAQFAYSNTNYILIGMLIEKLRQQPLNEVLRLHITEPYGLKNIYLEPFDPVAVPQVQGWTSFSQPNVYDTNAGLILNACSASMFSMAGAIVAQPSEVAKFTRLLWSGKILSSASLATMKTCTNLGIGGGNGYGYGTIRYVLGGKTCYGHSGDVNGFTTMTFHHEASDLTLTVEINRNGAPRVSIANALLAIANAIVSVGEAAESEMPVQVFPNPAREVLHLTLSASAKQDPLTVRLLDLYGRAVYENRFSPTDEAIRLPVGEIPNGLYLLEILQNSQRKVQKIIICH